MYHASVLPTMRSRMQVLGCFGYRVRYVPRCFRSSALRTSVRYDHARRDGRVSQHGLKECTRPSKPLVRNARDNHRNRELACVIASCTVLLRSSVAYSIASFPYVRRWSLVPHRCLDNYILRTVAKLIKADARWARIRRYARSYWETVHIMHQRPINISPSLASWSPG